MIFKKKILAIVTATALAVPACFGLAACNGGGGDDDTVYDADWKAPDFQNTDLSANLKLWCPDNARAANQYLVNQFTKMYPNVTVRINTVSEADAATNMLSDPSVGADVYFFASDQINRLRQGNALSSLTDAAVNGMASGDANYDPNFSTGILDRDQGSAIAPVTVVNGNTTEYAAFPATADNGYFLLYDNREFTADDVKSLDTMLTKLNGTQKTILYDYNNGWYNAGFFFAAGLDAQYVTRGENILFETNFNTTETGGKVKYTGLQAAKSLQTYINNPNFVEGDDTRLVSGFKDGTIVAGVTGTWNISNLEQQIGAANLSAVKLPTVKINGTDEQLWSFSGCKYAGVNPNTANREAAMALANFLTNEHGQQVRFEAAAAGPTNIEVAGSDAVKSNKGLAALATQNAFGYPQGDYPGAFWTQLEAIGNGLDNSFATTYVDDNAIQDGLNNFKLESEKI